MYCQSCQKKEATIHLTEITDGMRVETHLCEYCAQEKGIAVKSQIPINELLSNLLASGPSEEMFGETDRDLKCPHCGFTLERFSKEAVLGCPYDYELFEKSLLPLIEKAQDGKTSHCGKVPSRTSEQSKKHIELMTLRKQLQTAVQNEDYEAAAQLRDKISRLESGPASP